MPGDRSLLAQVLQGPLPRHPHPLLFVDHSPHLGDALLQVADDRRRLEADLARAQSLGDARQLLQLGADTEPVGGRALRHLALTRDPGRSALPGEHVITARRRPMNDLAQDTLEPIHHRREPGGIYVIEVGVGLKVGHSALEILHFEHAMILSNICSSVNINYAQTC